MILDTKQKEVIAVSAIVILIITHLVFYLLFTVRPKKIYNDPFIYDYINAHGGCEAFLSSKKYDSSKDEINKIIKLQYPILSIGFDVNDICK